MSNEYSIKFARFFFEFRRDISQDFAQLFTSSGSEEEGKNLSSKWGWYNVLYSMANSILDIDKITKMPIREVFTYLAYTQDYNNTKRNNYDNV